MKQVISAVCIGCGAEWEATPTRTTCKHCGGLLEIQYKYSYIKSVLTKEKISIREQSMWRYQELLPIEGTSQVRKLRVGMSPLYKTDVLAEQIGIKTLYVKDDGINPTSSLKDRASAMAVVKASEAGLTAIACSSTGNAASSLAGNCAVAGFASYIFVPERAPKGKVAQLVMFGAKVFLVKGSYEDTFRISAAAIEEYGWYNRNAAINPYLMEGKKTVSFEIAEQLQYEMPEYVVISVGDGCTIAGVWKGLKDLYQIGFIERLPKLISVQAEGCCPINTAAAKNESIKEAEENTLADSIAVGVPRNPDKAMRAIRESHGIVINVSDEEILDAMRLLGRTSGIFAEPAGAAGLAGLKKAVDGNLVSSEASAVCVVTGNGLKDVVNAIRAAGEPTLIEPDIAYFHRVYQNN